MKGVVNLAIWFDAAGQISIAHSAQVGPRVSSERLSCNLESLLGKVRTYIFQH